MVKDAVRDVVRDAKKDMAEDELKDTVKDVLKNMLKDMLKNVVKHALKDVVKDAAIALSEVEEPKGVEARHGPGLASSSLSAAGPLLPRRFPWVRWVPSSLSPPQQPPGC